LLQVTRELLSLDGCPDGHLFEEIAAGVPLIVENAEGLDAVARRLFEAGEHGASDIIRGFAEEEAAKMPVLLDAVRCEPNRRLDVLKCFYSHLAKRIYALTCTFPNIQTFSELGELVARERQPYYLDGPNSVDWIFRNSITAEREMTIYVDYVRNLTAESGGYGWSAPGNGRAPSGPYRPPESVELCRALGEAGAKSSSGLAVIAETWRGFEPQEDTSRSELRQLIVTMLTRLEACGHCDLDQAGVDRIVGSWSFPLWPFGLSARPDAKTIEELREERKLTIEWIESTEAVRDPSPAISRAKVEEMSAAYAAWEDECDREDRRLGQGKYSSSPFRPSSELAAHGRLPTYRRLESMFMELPDSERTALLALGWFTVDRVADWPRVYERARATARNPDYEISYGPRWLLGLERWEATPKPFEAGRWYRPDRGRE